MYVQTHMYVSFKMQSQKSVRLYKHSCTTRPVLLVTYQEIDSHVTVYINVYWTKLVWLKSSYGFQSSMMAKGHLCLSGTAEDLVR